MNLILIYQICRMLFKEENHIIIILGETTNSRDGGWGERSGVAQKKRT